jgi:hypothetical protein
VALEQEQGESNKKLQALLMIEACEGVLESCKRETTEKSGDKGKDGWGRPSYRFWSTGWMCCMLFMMKRLGRFQDVARDECKILVRWSLGYDW